MSLSERSTKRRELEVFAFKLEIAISEPRLAFRKNWAIRMDA